MKTILEKTGGSSQLSVCVLASGSRGNAIYISDGETSILVDAGLSGKEIERRMIIRDIKPESIDAIVISHDHTDHVLGAGVMSRRYNIPVYMNRKTFAAAEKKIGKINGLNFFECGKCFMAGSLKIHPFSISHDAADPAGFTVEVNNRKIGIATDLGIANLIVRQYLQNSNVLVLEANHDPEMLFANVDYPWSLKQRVKSRKGHLSNEEAGELLEELVHRDLFHIVLAHLSEDNNSPQKAFEVIQPVIDGFDINISIAGQHEPDEMILIS
jgi:phosphoribosyl 1,2-cyclic phosphodiesterase